MAAAHLTFTGESLALFAAAEDAIAQIPPAFPLDATVAVNPYLGQTAQDRATTAARLAKVGGGRMFLDRAMAAEMIADGRITEDDLSAAAAVHGVPAARLRAAAGEPAPAPAPLPTLADLAAGQDGIDWPALIEDRIGLWASAHFDKGQALWPAPEGTAFASWREFARRDLTPGLAGLKRFAAGAAALSDDPRLAIAESCAALGITEAEAPLYFHRLLTTLSGWGQYARHLGWTAERDGGRDETLRDLLAIRLVWDAALLEHDGAALADAWESARAQYAAPVAAGETERLDAALQEAADRGAERILAGKIAEAGEVRAPERPAIQAAFCIDVRSEILRRALEAADPGIETIGFAGFFGLPVQHRGHASDIVDARAPVLLAPAVETRSGGTEAADRAERIRLRGVRAWGRFKRAAVSAFAFVEAAGPLYIGKLLRDGLAQTKRRSADPAPVVDLPEADRINAAEQVLKAMSMTDRFARLVLIAGHGSHVTNAPHASALQCGACGGHAGDVNARLLAGLLNEPAVRAGLAGRGIEIPADTVFVPGLHDTVSDDVTIYEQDLAERPAAELAQLRAALARAGATARTERAAVLPRADQPAGLPRRGLDWSELRPEWGLAGCAGFVAAPRHRSRGADLGGRVFLHDYDWRQDPELATLELILSAPVVVASWISLQYHGSSVAPEVFGAGNKLLHNVVGGIGVLEGNGGALRAGLPFQSVHDGEALRHTPLRLTVAAEAPVEAISEVLERQPQVRALFDNGWLALYAIDDEGLLSQRYEGGSWVPAEGAAAAARQAA